MKETSFATALEKAFYDEVQSLRSDRDRLLRKIDASEERAKRLEEMMHLRAVRASAHTRPLHGPYPEGSF